VNYVITITPTLVVNNYTGSTSCDSTYSYLTGALTTFNSMYNEPDFSSKFICAYSSPLAGVYVTTSTSNETVLNSRIGYMFSKYAIDKLCTTPPVSGWTDTVQSYGYGDVYVFTKYAIRIEITNIDDPVNNYSVYNAKQSDGSVDYNNLTLIYHVP
jgi:hypothetical protein